MGKYQLGNCFEKVYCYANNLIIWEYLGIIWDNMGIIWEYIGIIWDNMGLIWE